jgi:purine nucleosidase
VKRVILDTDVGTDVDDALAITLAVASPELKIEGITTVHADAPLRARIAQRLLELAGCTGIPVVAGASFPIAMPLPEKFHWNPRLRGHEGHGLLPPQDLTPTSDLHATADEAARFIIERAAANAGELSLIAIGPLTNLGRALQLEPGLRDMIRDVTLMGGMVDAQRVPWPPVLETNLNADPGAAEIVFASGIPLTIVGFEVTTQVFLSPAQRAEIRSWDQPLTNVLVTLMEQMLENFATFSQEMELTIDIFQGRTYMHDPLAICTSIASDFVLVRPMHVQLGIHDYVLRTMPYADRDPNVRVCIDVNAPEMVHFWLSRIKGLVTGVDTVSKSSPPGSRP